MRRRLNFNHFTNFMLGDSPDPTSIFISRIVSVSSLICVAAIGGTSINQTENLLQRLLTYVGLGAFFLSLISLILLAIHVHGRDNAAKGSSDATRGFFKGMLLQLGLPVFVISFVIIIVVVMTG